MRAWLTAVLIALSFHAAAEPPALAARYAVRTDTPGTSAAPGEWLLWREADRVETQAGGRGDFWQRGPKGTVLLTRLYHPEKRAVEYYPSDLAALGMRPDWGSLAHVIDPRHLGAALKPAGGRVVLGRAATVYRGALDGRQIEVWWLENEQLPARLEKTLPGGRFVMELREILPIAAAPWRRADASAYRAIDYADLGDHENDPFVTALVHGAAAHDHAGH